MWHLIYIVSLQLFILHYISKVLLHSLLLTYDIVLLLWRQILFLYTVALLLWVLWITSFPETSDVALHLILIGWREHVQCHIAIPLKHNFCKCYLSPLAYALFVGKRWWWGGTRTEQDKAVRPLWMCFLFLSGNLNLSLGFISLGPNYNYYYGDQR